MGRLRTSVFGRLAFTVAFAFSTLLLGLGADAGVQWCESDPVFLVNGAVVDVTTGFPATYKGTLQGAVAYEVLVPANATATVVSLPASVPTTAKISRVLPATGLLSLGVPVIVKVTINATASFGTKTQVTGAFLWLSSTAYGTSNVTTKVNYTLVGL